MNENHIFHALVEKVNTLELASNLIKYSKQNRSEVQEFIETAKEVVRCYSKAMSLHKKQIELNKSIEKTIDLVEKHSNNLELFSIEMDNKENNVNECNVSQEEEEEICNETQEVCYLSSVQPDKASLPSIKYPKKRMILDMEELYAEEYDEIPIYMRKKLTTKTINAFINKFNEEISKKYSKGKAVNNYNDPELKKELFLTESELIPRGRQCLSKEEEDIVIALNYLKKIYIKRIIVLRKMTKFYIVKK